MVECSVDGCADPVDRRNFCSAHYARFCRHGHPLGGARPQHKSGTLQRYFEEVVLPYRGDDCLIWPFSRNRPGYAHIWRDGKNRIVSRLACEEVHGPPPNPTDQAAHSCGNGHLGCVAPLHLAWKSPSENQRDRIVHGTHMRGERHYGAKITADVAKQIASMRGHHTQRSIGEMFGVSESIVADIHRGKTWSSVTGLTRRSASLPINPRHGRQPDEHLGPRAQDCHRPPGLRRQPRKGD